MLVFAGIFIEVFISVLRFNDDVCLVQNFLGDHNGETPSVGSASALFNDGADVVFLEEPLILTCLLELCSKSHGDKIFCRVFRTGRFLAIVSHFSTRLTNKFPRSLRRLFVKRPVGDNHFFVREVKLRAAAGWLDGGPGAENFEFRPFFLLQTGQLPLKIPHEICILGRTRDLIYKTFKNREDYEMAVKKQSKKESLIVASKVKAYVRSKKMLASSELLGAVNEMVYSALDAAAARAKANRRSTIKAQDV